MEVPIVPPDVAAFVARTGNVDNAAVVRGEEEFGYEKVGEEEVPDVVRAPLRFETFRGRGPRDGHECGVVDQAVDGVGVGEHLGGGAADLGLRGEVEVEELGRAGGGGVVDGFLGGSEVGRVAAGEDDRGGRLFGDLQSDFRTEGAESDACDEDVLGVDLGGEVFGYFFGGGAGCECCCHS